MGLRSIRGGLLLDAILAIGIVIVVAFLLNLAGISFASLIQGAAHFFGL